MTKPMMDLRELVEKSGDADLLRELMQDAAQRLMDIEVAAKALLDDADLLRVGALPTPPRIVRREDLEIRNDLRACHRA